MGFRALSWLLLGPMLLAGCATIQVPMKTEVAKVETDARIPLRATLLRPETARAYRFRGKPESLTGGARTYEFPLGAELESVSREAFAQVFQQVDLAQEQPDAQRAEIVIVPEIVDFHFRYDQLSHFGIRLDAVSRARARVTMSDATGPVWTYTAESPEARSGSWYFATNYEEHTAKASSVALASAIEAIANAAAKAPELRKLSERVRSERGPLQP